MVVQVKCELVALKNVGAKETDFVVELNRRSRNASVVIIREIFFRRHCKNDIIRVVLVESSSEARHIGWDVALSTSMWLEL